jgi:hypothetical protein
LAHGHLGQDTINKMRRRIGHASPTTRTTESAPFARKRHQSVGAAVVAIHTYEAVGKYSALEKVSEFTLDKPRRRTTTMSRLIQKGFETISDHLVQNGLVGLSRSVCGRGVVPDDEGGALGDLPAMLIDQILKSDSKAANGLLGGNNQIAPHTASQRQAKGRPTIFSS